MTLPSAVLAAMLRADGTAPRLTTYDDTDSPTRGERIELSAKVIANWVAKAANLLQDEFDVSTGTSIRLALPAHWRTAYWALAAWSVGATVVLGRPEEVPDPDDLALTVTDDPVLAGEPDVDPAVLVTLAALSRSAPTPPPTGVLDEARELATFADTFTAWDEVGPGDTGLITATGTTAYGDLVRAHDGGRVHLLDPSPEAFLRTSLDVWAAGGSIVLSRGRPAPDTLAARLGTERATPA
ncbi:MAG: TIGR03089 family protein [Actinobacteria bacterium]|jgi:conserved hypothetical protein TIGR03089|nr:TIGR03089 family protein [Actinomycetota bacterium]